MKMFMLQEGGYENVSFTSKDLYYKLEVATQKETPNGDVESPIAHSSNVFLRA